MTAMTHRPRCSCCRKWLYVCRCANTATIEPAAEYPSTAIRRREDIEHHLHTITVERIAPGTASQLNAPEIAGELAVIERFKGVVSKALAVESDLPDGITIQHAARGFAGSFHATYIEA